MQICRQIDSLERFVDVAEQNVAAVEQTVNRADEELGVNSLGIKGLLLRGKKWATEAATGANGGGSGANASTVSSPPVFDAPEVYRTSDYFVGNVLDDHVNM